MLYIWLIVASFLWGCNVLVMRYMLVGVSSYTLALLKVLLSIISIFIIMKIKNIKFNKYPFLLVLKISLFSITVNFILTFEGLNLISGSSNAIVNSLAPMITIILSVIIYHSKIKKNQLIALSIAILAFFLSINFDITKFNVGHIMMIGGIVFYSYGNLLMQYNCKRNDSLSFTLQYLILSFFQLLIIVLLFPNRNDFSNVSWSLWLLFIVFSGIGFAIIQLVYFRAIHEIGSIRSSFLLGLNPIFTYLGSLLLNEKFSLNIFIAMILLIIAMIIVSKSKLDKDD